MSSQLSPQVSPIGINTVPLDIPIHPIRVSEFGTPLPSVTTLIDGTFEGGGTLGAAYAGALLALARNKVWFKRVAGNSAGAITASLIAAGYDANEIDFLFTPKDIQKPRPANLPANILQNAIDYHRFIDFPTSATDVSPDTKKNHLIYKLVKGTILDEIRQTKIDLPATTQLIDALVDQVIAKLPDQVGPFNWTLPEASIDVGPFQYTTPKETIRVGAFSRTIGGQTIEVGPFQWKVPAKDITVGPFDLTLTAKQKDAIREAITNVWNLYPTRLSLAELAWFDTEPLRTQLADRCIDQALNQDPFYRLFLNFVGDGGVLKGDEFLRTMRQLLEAKLNKHPVTFQDLPLDLAVIAADTTAQKMLVYSKAFSPQMEVAEAVRRSMSVPFIYEPRVDQGHEIMDGGLCENYPFWIHLLNQSGEDATRIKIGFYLNSEADANVSLATANNCPTSSHQTANTLANTTGSFVENLLAPNTGSLMATGTAPLAEVKLLHRIARVNATRNQKTALHDAMLDYYANHSTFKLYQVEIPLKGFFWLDFNIEQTTYNGMCCRGWEATLKLLQEKALVATNELVSTNPYKGGMQIGGLIS